MLRRTRNRVTLEPKPEAAAAVVEAPDLMFVPGDKKTTRERLAPDTLSTAKKRRVPLSRRAKPGSLPGPETTKTARASVEEGAPASDFNRTERSLSGRSLMPTTPVPTPWSKEYSDAMVQAAGESGTVRGGPIAEASGLQDSKQLQSLAAELKEAYTSAKGDDAAEDAIEEQMTLVQSLAKIARVRPLSPEEESMVREIAGNLHENALKVGRYA